MHWKECDSRQINVIVKLSVCDLACLLILVTPCYKVIKTDDFLRILAPPLKCLSHIFPS